MKAPQRRTVKAGTAGHRRAPAATENVTRSLRTGTDSRVEPGCHNHPSAHPTIPLLSTIPPKDLPMLQLVSGRFNGERRSFGYPRAFDPCKHQGRQHQSRPGRLGQANRLPKG
ncbi:uncharacterized protein METZ01_LOCUS195338, partial [marine metagenome]